MRLVVFTDFTQFVKLEPVCWQMDIQQEMVGHRFKSVLIYNCERSNISQIFSLSHPIVELFCFCTFSANLNFS